MSRPAADPLQVHIHRYELALSKLDPAKLKEQLPSIHAEYSFFLGEQYDSPQNLGRLQAYLSDTLIKSLFLDTKAAYPRLDSTESELGAAFAYYHKAFPDEKIPRVYTYVSGLDYENPVHLADSVMLIGLDMYLGQSSRYYKQLGLPEYKCLSLGKNYIAADCMSQLAYRLIRDSKRDKTLLDWMILQGKVMYFLDATLLAGKDAFKISYKPDQLEWCKKNEALIWSFFISQKLLFSTDKKNVQDFISEAPFTKGFPKESPGRIGVWVGWQIVRAYMENNSGLSLKQLLEDENSQQILKLSGYKPEK
ncbi:MAG: hypothetical protein WCO63_03030 [Bacteroidota bacterium]